MTELELIYEGRGRFVTADKGSLAIAHEEFGEGEVLTFRAAKKRSLRQLRWFFHMVHAALDNQRAGPDFQGDPERLRKWLLIRVGHCNEKRFAPQAMTREVAAWLRETYSDIDLSTNGHEIIVRTARSISRKECGHDEMCAIADRVVDVICEEIVPGSMRADWEPYLERGRKSLKAIKAAETAAAA